MKQSLLTLVLTLLMCMVGLQAFADWDTSTKVQVGDLYYYLDNDNLQAQVTSMPDGNYTDDIEIPSTFNYQENTYNVTSIGERAFYGCSGLISVTMGIGVTSIGDYSFYGCSKLTSITIPNSVTSIGNCAFRDCSGLTSVTIPNSVTSVGIYAFGECKRLTSVTLNSDAIVSNTSSDNIKSIFGEQVTEYVIGDNVTSIANNVFKDCSGLTSITIGNSVESIGSSAFYNCSGLTSVTIPNSVTSIGDWAFYNCSGLTSVTIPNSVTSIGIAAFLHCTGLTSVVIGSGVTSIGDDAFFCWGSGLTSVTVLNPTPVAIDSDVFSNRKNATLYVLRGSKSAYQVADYWKEFKNIIEIPYLVIDGVNYELNDFMNQAFVVSMPGKYTGDIEIPSSITYNNKNYSVTHISDYAFSGCSDLTSITIPNSIQTWGYSVFSGCTGLTSVTLNCNTMVSRDDALTNIIMKSIFGEQVKEYIIGDDVTSIGRYIFSGCSALTSITIPNSVTSIGFGAFQNCPSLTSVNIPDGVTSIKTHVFLNCPALTSITIPNSVTSIGNEAFLGCTGLETIKFGNGLTKIEERAFGSSTSSGECVNLKKIIIDDVATWLKITFAAPSANPLYYAHHLYSDENTEITDLTIPDVTNIPDYAFINCSGLTSVTIPNSVESIAQSAFEGCSGLTSVTIPNSVESIAQSAFAYCPGLTSVTLGNSVTSIGSGAFASCSGLTSVTIPNSVTSIGSSAFWRCSNLTSVTIGNSVTSLGNQAFYNCSSLISITIPNSVTSIGNDAFYNCSSLISITIGNSVTSIGNSAFQNCSGLKKVIVSDIAAWCRITFAYSDSNPLSIAHHLYSDMNTEITELVIPDDVTSIGYSSFYGCSGLTSITISNSVESIAQSAFEGCSGLTSVTLGNSVESIGKNAFQECTGLTKVIVNDIAAWCKISFGNGDSNPLNLAHHLYSDENTEITDLVIPNNVTSVKFAAFLGCSSLASVIIPNSVTSIGKSAFCYCSGLNSVTIGNSVTSISEFVFYDCSNLTSVTVLNSTPVAIAQNVFTNRMNATLYVPKGSKEAYEVADYWNEFKNIVEMDAKVGDVNGDGDIDIADAVCIVNHVVGKSNTTFNAAAADVNDDGEVDIADAVKIVNLVVGKIDALARPAKEVKDEKVPQ